MIYQQRPERRRAVAQNAEPSCVLLPITSCCCAPFAQVAEDECRHFLALAKRLEELGSHYGAFPVHDGCGAAACCGHTDVRWWWTILSSSQLGGSGCTCVAEPQQQQQQLKLAGACRPSRPSLNS